MKWNKVSEIDPPKDRFIYAKSITGKILKVKCGNYKGEPDLYSGEENPINGMRRFLQKKYMVEWKEI